MRREEKFGRDEISHYECSVLSLPFHSCIESASQIDSIIALRSALLPSFMFLVYANGGSGLYSTAY